MLFSQDGADETPHGRPVGKDTHYIGPAPYLLVQALLGVVGPHLLPVGHREGGEGQDVRSSLGQYRGGLREPVSELIDHPVDLGVHLLGGRLQTVRTMVATHGWARLGYQNTSIIAMN